MTQEAGGQKVVPPDGTNLRGGLVNAGVGKSGFLPFPSYKQGSDLFIFIQGSHQVLFAPTSLLES